MLPNGGFPPLKKCKEEKKKEDVEKGFFFSSTTNISIRDIFKKNSNKKNEIDNKDEEDLEIAE